MVGNVTILWTIFTLHGYSVIYKFEFQIVFVFRNSRSDFFFFFVNKTIDLISDE